MHDPIDQIPSAVVAAAFPELDEHERILRLLKELGFTFSGTSFFPSAQQKHIDILINGMFNASEAKTVHSLVSKISEANTHGGMRTRLAVLKISEGSVNTLEKAVISALEDDRDVMMNAEMRQRNDGRRPPLAPGVPNRSIQKLREYILWLMRYLEPNIYAKCGPIGK